MKLSLTHMLLGFRYFIALRMFPPWQFDQFFLFLRIQVHMSTEIQLSLDSVFEESKDKNYFEWYLDFEKTTILVQFLYDFTLNLSASIFKITIHQGRNQCLCSSQPVNLFDFVNLNEK